MERTNFCHGGEGRTLFGLEHVTIAGCRCSAQHNEDYEKQVEAGMKSQRHAAEVPHRLQAHARVPRHPLPCEGSPFKRGLRPPGFHLPDFEMFLRTDKHCCNTVAVRLPALRTMPVFIAINNEWLTRDPFRVSMKSKKEETTRDFLTKDEIRLLMEELKNAKQRLYRSLYLFLRLHGAVVRGYAQLTEENIRTYFDEHVDKHQPPETGVVSNIRLLDIANRISPANTGAAPGDWDGRIISFRIITRACRYPCRRRCQASPSISRASELSPHGSHDDIPLKSPIETVTHARTQDIKTMQIYAKSNPKDRSSDQTWRTLPQD